MDIIESMSVLRKLTNGVRRSVFLQYSYIFLWASISVFGFAYAVAGVAMMLFCHGSYQRCVMDMIPLWFFLLLR